MQSKNKLAIFDLDGTLFDTRNVNYFAYCEALSMYGVNLDYDFFCSKCNGKKYTQFLPTICSLKESDIETIHKLKKRFYSKHLSKARINENLFDIIESIKNNYFIALVTTASKANTLDLLKYFKKEKVFDLIVTQDDLLAPKPNPEGFLKAQLHFNVGPDDTIIFEDSKVGEKAAMKCTKKIYMVKGFR